MSETNNNHDRAWGFTLIELSIVLVIIGFIIGGIVVGRELIKQSELRSIISDVDKFKAITNTFRNKYGALPGNILATNAAKFGLFTFTGSFAKESPPYGSYAGGNNGVILGEIEYGCYWECGAFWRHLSDAGLIPAIGANISANTNYATGCPGVPAGEACLNDKEALYMPKTKLNRVFWGVGGIAPANHLTAIPGIDYNRNIFFLANMGDASRTYINAPTMSAVDSYGLDVKIDDGKPNSGKFMVSLNDTFVGGYPYWAASAAGLNTNSRICTTGGGLPYSLTSAYNAVPATGGNNLSCYPAFIW